MKDWVACGWCGFHYRKQDFDACPHCQAKMVGDRVIVYRSSNISQFKRKDEDGY